MVKRYPYSNQYNWITDFPAAIKVALPSVHHESHIFLHIVTSAILFEDLNIFSCYQIFRRIQCNVAKRSVVQCCTVQYSTVKHNTIRYKGLIHNAVRYKAIIHNIVQYGTVKHNAVRYKAIIHNIVRYSKAQCSTLQGTECITARYRIFFTFCARYKTEFSGKSDSSWKY